MESFLESCILDEIPHSLVKQLAKYVRTKQMEKSPFSRSDTFVNEMMEKYAEWLSEQDLPEPIIRTNALMISHARASAGSSLLKKGRSMEKISPSMLGSRMKLSSTESTTGQSISTPQHVLRRLPETEDDVFVMDEIDVSPASSSATAMPISVPVPAWKPSGSTRSVDHLLIILRVSVVNFSILISVWT